MTPKTDHPALSELEPYSQSKSPREPRTINQDVGQDDEGRFLAHSVEPGDLCTVVLPCPSLTASRRRAATIPALPLAPSRPATATPMPRTTLLVKAVKAVTAAIKTRSKPGPVEGCVVLYVWCSSRRSMMRRGRELFDSCGILFSDHAH